jgi:hypothetical protein
MRCWNCYQQISEDAKVCQYCEASVEPSPSDETVEAVREAMQQMPPTLWKS